MTHIEFALF